MNTESYFDYITVETGVTAAAPTGMSTSPVPRHSIGFSDGSVIRGGFKLCPQ